MDTIQHDTLPDRMELRHHLLARAAAGDLIRCRDGHVDRYFVNGIELGVLLVGFRLDDLLDWYPAPPVLEGFDHEFATLTTSARDLLAEWDRELFEETA